MNGIQERKTGLSIRWKILIVFILLFVLLFGGVFAWFFNFAGNLYLEVIREDLENVAAEAAAAVDAEAHRALSESGEADDENYTRISETLRNWLVYHPRIDAIYTNIETDEPGILEFVVSADPDPEERAGFLEEYDASELPAMVGAFSSDIPTSDQWVAGDRFGAWLSGYAPIQTEDGETVAIVGADIEASRVLEIQREVIETSLIAFGVAIVALTGGVMFVSSIITGPLLQISKAAEIVEDDELDFDPDMLAEVAKRNDELGQLARVFSDMAVKVEARERKLKQEIQELRIEIDTQKRDEQVANITESEFFTDLQTRATEMRRRSQRRGTDEVPAEEDSE